jgi:two-component system response regulator HydG
MQAWLTVEQGESNRPVCELALDQPVTLGRHPSNTIVLRDEHASRWHATFLHDGGRWVLCNIGNPVNTTLVNGQRVLHQASLQHGSEIVIGNTRLRFSVKSGDGLNAGTMATQGRDRSSTPLQPGELTVLCAFLAHAVEETDPRQLIRLALKTVVQQTQAAVAGFLSLDADAPLPKMLWPEAAQVDVQLSRKLTQQVQREARSVWLGHEAPDAPDASLNGYTDALCVPLRATGTALGALHVYHAAGLFNERQQRFCEVLSGYLASGLNSLRVRRCLEAENSRLRGRATQTEELVGSGQVIQKLCERIAKAAPRPSTVLIQGESGVGKELVALALHRQSPRSQGPLVVVNCAAITSTLMEAELFGHCKGAFTGADRDRPGLFQQADDGTLFLDEIGELPLECQAKLLRVVEGHAFRPVGASHAVQVDVRIVAATNRNLDEEVRKNKFRQDLLFRLQVIQIQVPSLREHPEDIPELTDYFLARLARKCGQPPVQLTEAALRHLCDYSWPGNVRQLWAVLESAAMMVDHALLDAHDLPIPSEAAAHPANSLNLAAQESWAIRQALQQTDGNISQAARLLGVNRDTLSARIKRRGIDRDQA